MKKKIENKQEHTPKIFLVINIKTKDIKGLFTNPELAENFASDGDEIVKRYAHSSISTKNKDFIL
jgi:hypothetical protein